MGTDNHGVFVKFEDLGIRTLPGSAQSCIGVVGTAPDAKVTGKFGDGTPKREATPTSPEIPAAAGTKIAYDKPHLITSLSDLIGEDGTSDLGTTGTLPNALAAIYSQIGQTPVQMVIVPTYADYPGVKHGDFTPDLTATGATLATEKLKYAVAEKSIYLGEDLTKAKAATPVAGKAERKGMYALLLAEPRPKILIAPPPIVALTDTGWAGPDRTAPDIPKALVDLATDMRGVAIIGGPSDWAQLSSSAPPPVGFSNGLISSGGIPTAYIVGPQLLNIAGATVDAAAYAAGAFAASDAQYDVATSPSSSVLSGITGQALPIDYIPGLAGSRSQILNAANIATVINDGSLKLFGNTLYHTPADQTGLRFVPVKRTLDKIIDELVKGMQWALDKKINIRTFEQVTQTINAYLGTLAGNRLILGGECYIDKDETTVASLKAGRASVKVNYTPIYPINELNISVNFTDEFLGPLLEAL